MATKGVFFDLYGTLLVYGDMDHAWDAWTQAFHNALAEYGLALPETAGEPREGMFGRSEKPAVVVGLTPYERMVRAFCLDSGFEPGAECLRATAVATIRAWSRYVSLDPDAHGVLDELQRSTTLALVSNFDHPPHVHSILAELGLSPFFNAVVISGEVGVEKPDPAIFGICLEKTGLSPAEVVHVGDSPEDVAGATAAGCRAVLIARHGGEGGSCTGDVPVISGLREVLSLL